MTIELTFENIFQRVLRFSRGAKPSNSSPLSNFSKSQPALQFTKQNDSRADFENIFQRKIILARREAVKFLSSVKFLKMSACYSIFWAKWPYSWLLRISFSAKWFSRGVKPSNSFLLVLNLSRGSHHVFREHFLQNLSREHMFREYSSYISRTNSRERLLENHIFNKRD